MEKTDVLVIGGSAAASATVSADTTVSAATAEPIAAGPAAQAHSIAEIGRKGTHSPAPFHEDRKGCSNVAMAGLLAYL